MWCGHLLYCTLGFLGWISAHVVCVLSWLCLPRRRGLKPKVTHMTYFGYMSQGHGNLPPSILILLLGVEVILHPKKTCFLYEPKCSESSVKKNISCHYYSAFCYPLISFLQFTYVLSKHERKQRWNATA